MALGEEVYIMRIVRGSLTDPSFLDRFPHKIIEKFTNDPNWDSWVQVKVSMPEIREIQKRMIKHYDTKTPWYADGWLEENPQIVICAFGADDEEGGRVFIFERNNKEEFMECKQYGISQGIPEEQIDFLDK